VLYAIEVAKENELKHAFMSDFIEKIDFVELETSENSLIGIISKICMIENRIYVLDIYKTRSLFMFDKQGLFIKKLAQIGNGPGEYLVINDFLVDKELQEVLLLVDGGRRIIYMDYNGNYLRDFKLKQTLFSYIFPLENDYILGYHVTGGNKYLLHVVDKDFKEKRKYIAIPEEYYKMTRGRLVDYTGFQINYLFVPPLSPIIYAISSDRCISKYEFNVDVAYKLTSQKIAEAKYYDEETFVKKTWDFFDLTSFFDLHGYLFATYTMNKNTYWCRYDIKSNEFQYVNLKNIKNNMQIDPSQLKFLYQIDEKTIAGFLIDPVREDEGLNPLIVICRMKNFIE
jgi:hypothetical protein